MTYLHTDWNSVVLLCIKAKGNADEHFSDADLWIPFPGNGYALTKFAE